MPMIMTSHGLALFLDACQGQRAYQTCVHLVSSFRFQLGVLLRLRHMQQPSSVSDLAVPCPLISDRR